ncbi:hypothetical protein DN752_13455 [Echinicola strongylocentroti]|uniref:Uncharacterized protein n=1 Tax=Echinicola strongylocentroti TaxID=1795355 RepID=A0A2Z4IKI2_9BACT|nr:DUF6702 family protein [Echinicola strongylocentroti]AWW31048.1 hypothetical protein DN752_13455 [Echinicola strongylocentroti]
MLYNYIVSMIIGWVVYFHPFYISVTDISYNETSQSLEIAQKIFWDDLEVALGNVTGERVDFMNPADPEGMSKRIKKYLLEHNHITVNGKEASLVYLGFEVEEDAAWFYLEATAITKPGEVVVTNEILISDYPDQRNMVNFYVDDTPKTLILHKDNEVGELSF